MLLSRETVEGLYITGKCVQEFFFFFFFMHNEMVYVFSKITVQEQS